MRTLVKIYVPPFLTSDRNPGDLAARLLDNAWPARGAARRGAALKGSRQGGSINSECGEAARHWPRIPRRRLAPALDGGEGEVGVASAEDRAAPRLRRPVLSRSAQDRRSVREDPENPPEFEIFAESVFFSSFSGKSALFECSRAEGISEM